MVSKLTFRKLQFKQNTWYLLSPLLKGNCVGLIQNNINMSQTFVDFALKRFTMHELPKSFYSP